MVLSNTDIQKFIESGDIIIDPFDPANLKPGSYTFSLSSKFCKLKQKEYLDTRDEKHEYDEFEMAEQGYLLQPRDFIIGFIAEKIVLNNKVFGILSTRGSRAQMGLDALQSDQFQEPGSRGHMALAMTNISSIPIKLYPGIKIVKGIFLLMSGKPTIVNADKGFVEKHLLTLI